MSAAEAKEREAVVAEAESWIGTPFHDGARVKGGGVDCAQLLVGVFSAPGVALIPALDVPPYRPDWHLHQTDERYLRQILAHAREVPAPTGPGDVALWRFGRCFSHGAIVAGWPRIIHAVRPRCVMAGDTERDLWLVRLWEDRSRRHEKRPVRFFSYWR